MHRRVALEMPVIPSKPQGYFAFSDEYNMCRGRRCNARTNFFVGRKDKTGERGSLSARRMLHRH